ncbi:TFIIH complex serine/threonine-protein kinase subunit kin28 [Ascosphaera pollenicola]|nr:TFIIH complex serine/threonine-protein kinase subunit kin28 [Ascosphaera pollenicola]
MQHSQLAPFPDDLPFRIVSKTIGQGAYACIKRACPVKSDSPIFAVKFVHKEYASRNGRMTPRQLQLEVTLHKHIGMHENIIAFYQTGENSIWRWIAMELAEGGDLFDKIEADEGVGEDIAHAYFVQLINAVDYMHSKGVGHRDIKPENILLSADGNLKIADFGLATLFRYNGKEKLSVSLCGSPPYIAPEVISRSTRDNAKGSGYRADLVDIWSCGVVLFVLLVGNTPWDSPTEESYEFCEYVKSNLNPEDDLWARLPPAAASLLRGMMHPDATQRLTMKSIRQHPWVDRETTWLAPDGKLANPVRVATNMFESLHIDMTQDPMSVSQPRPSPAVNGKSSELEAVAGQKRKRELTGPEEPIEEPVDWDGPPRLTQDYSQSHMRTGPRPSSQQILLQEQLFDEPSMSQFSPTPSVPLSRTQNAQRFGDIVPPSSLTKFFSPWSGDSLAELICQSLKLLHIQSVPEAVSDGFDDAIALRIRMRDDRQCPMSGIVVIQNISEDCTCAEFKKSKGDPLQWRRLFKKVVILCKDAVIKPESHSQ